MVESDYLKRANVDVIAGEIKSINLEKNEIVIKNAKEKVFFDKVLIAWGAAKKRLN